jgi:hypothetical protein
VNKKRAVQKKQVAAEEAKQNRRRIQDNPLLSERQNTRREKGHKRFNYAGRKLIQEKKQNTRKTTKMISDREDKKRHGFCL